MSRRGGAPGLAFRRETGSVSFMATSTVIKSRSTRERRAAQARRRRAEDRADYALAAKRCADIDAGRVKVYSREEAIRELGL
jgi:hypothetical protein